MHRYPPRYLDRDLPTNLCIRQQNLGLQCRWFYPQHQGSLLETTSISRFKSFSIAKTTPKIALAPASKTRTIPFKWVYQATKFGIFFDKQNFLACLRKKYCRRKPGKSSYNYGIISFLIRIIHSNSLFSNLFPTERLHFQHPELVEQVLQEL